MPNKDKPLRVGSVAYNRAHGLNKAAGGPGKSGGSAPKPSAPKPSAPKPSSGGGGGSSPRPSGGGGGGGSSSPRPGSVAYNRAHGLNKAAGGPGKQTGENVAYSAAGSNQSQALTRAQQRQGSVAYNRLHGLNKAATKGAASQNVNDLFNPNQSGGSQSGSSGGGTPWDKFRQDFSQQGLHDFAQELWDNTSEVSGLKKGPKFQAAILGENGFYMDGNAPMVLPKGVKDYGFKPGDQFFDPDKYTPHAENAGMDPSMGGSITGKIAYFKADGTPMFEVGHDANPNWDKYQDGQERMSSEGLYQDKYNVGYHGADDEGDMFASNAALGSVASYFKDYNNGKKDFSQVYHDFVEGDRTGGYAGDVLKLIDQGRMKVTDDQYNRIVVDAQNYNWDQKNARSGPQGSYYDVRAGGTASGYEPGGSLTKAGGVHDDARAQAMNQTGSQQQSQAYQQQQMVNTYQEPQSANPNLGSVSGGRTNAYQNWQDKQGSGNKDLNINFNFDPYKFMQGQ